MGSSMADGRRISAINKSIRAGKLTNRMTWSNGDMTHMPAKLHRRSKFLMRFSLSFINVEVSKQEFDFHGSNGS